MRLCIPRFLGPLDKAPILGPDVGPLYKAPR